VDEASGASQGLRGHNLPRAAAMKRKSISKSNIPAAAASKRSKQPIERIAEGEESSEKEEDSGSDYGDDEGGLAGAFQVDAAAL
jgi:ribosomal protein L12E/L44/L45/RPP1/RPP2